MREGWTYKDFETCLRKVPKAKQVQTSEYDKGSKYPIISQEDKLISGYSDDESMLFCIERPVVIFGDHTRALKYINFNFVVGADGVKILDTIEELDAKFLYYYLKWYNVPSLGYSRHYKLLKEIKVPLPPKSQQEAIVSELDEINSLLALKREQLQTYDKLAQSLFYEMFGDPVENEKGWEVKKLEGFATLINGRAYKQEELLDEGKYPVLRVGNFFTNNSWYYSDLELEADKYCEKGDLLYAWSASFGPRIWNGEKVIYHYHIWKIKLSDMVDKTYLLYLLQRMTNDLKQQVHGATMVHLTKAKMEQTKLPLPPLPLQRQFASRIEQIGEQKKQVTAAIERLETLLASRMQYWFE